MFSMVSSLMLSISVWPSKSSFSDTEPFDSSDSYRLIGRINMRDIRPVPVWAVAPSVGTAEPVSRNWPISSRRSTSKSTASHSTGAICHSSISRGVAPFSNSEGFVSAMLRYVPALSGSCMYRTLRAARWAVLVLPHHFAPSISTAPAALSSRCSTLSDMRCR